MPVVDRENTCKACEGAGMLADDEGWQYHCSVCRGDGVLSSAHQSAEIMSVDENNRLLD
jgi:DnaJ-class molecular chaperone